MGGAGQATTPAPPTTTPTPPYVKPDCVDQNEHCAAWARLEECQKNPSWMLVYCPASCDQCDVSCEDNNVYCEQWAELGECGRWDTVFSISRKVVPAP